MLFTDGGEDRAQDVFMQYNWPNKTVGFVSQQILLSYTQNIRVYVCVYCLSGSSFHLLCGSAQLRCHTSTVDRMHQQR